MSDQLVNISDFKRFYFIGIGGIGMSSLARYFKSKGYPVAGYDKTATELTKTLESEGIEIHFEDLQEIPTPYSETQDTLIIYTPAIPKEMGELVYAQTNGFTLKKRSEVLGMITRDSKAIAVAGTHGKTTTSTLLAHILYESPLKCNAFLGGISSNFNSNFVASDSELTVVEADEFDRSFLQLSPFASIITSTDADHLDIYGNSNDFLEGFKAYVNCISDEGFLIRNINVAVQGKHEITYGIDCQADYIGSNLRYEEGAFLFDLQTPQSIWRNVELGIPGIHNAENAIACVAMCEKLGLEESIIRKGLSTFKGVKRRFEYQVKTKDLIYIDDYAHHPTEINALLASIKLLYPQQRVTGVFQPHLYTRTRDFFDGFAGALSALDEVILLPIYPARELPIGGINSDALCDKIPVQNKKVLSPEETINYLGTRKEGVILTIGAGDIDRIVKPLKTALTSV